ncbi:MAG: hypothetical protein WCG19_03995 [Chlorobiaceae bacterium]
MKYKVVMMALLLASLPFTQAAAEDNACWNWALTPYLWGSSVTADLKLPQGQTTITKDAKFTDIISKLQMAFMGHVEGQGDNVGAFADIIYLSLGDNRNRELYSSDSHMKSFIGELAGVWSPGEKRGEGIEPFAGLRYLSMKLDAEVDPVNPVYRPLKPSFNTAYTDVMVGLRYRGSFSDKWGYSVRGDGSWGGTNGIYTASAIISYRLEKGEWDLGYRYMNIDLDASSNNLKLQMYGPILAYTFKF